MKTSMRLFLFLLPLSIVFTSCSKGDSDKGGSDSTVDGNPNTLKIKGSETELSIVQDLIDTYKADNDGVEIEVTGGGSGTGIQALINGEVDVANSSRQITEAELAEAEKNGVDPVAVIFGVDAVAVVTNSKLGVDSLSIMQLRDIFRGQIKNWKEVGGPDMEITLYGRNATSGTYGYFQQRVVKGNYCTDMNELGGNEEIVNSVIDDKSGIGYVGAGFLMDENGKPRSDMWAMMIYIDGDRAYSPYEVYAVNSGDYPMVRPLYQYCNGDPEGNLLDFLKFELSAEGQNIIRRHGYFQINDNHRLLNQNRAGIHFNPKELANR